MIWIVVTLCILAAFWHLRTRYILAQNRNLVVKAIGKKWYDLAISEIHKREAHDFLKTNFSELFAPNLVKHDQEWLLARTAALGVYLKACEQWGLDASKYHQLPVNTLASIRAWESSRAIISTLSFRRRTQVLWKLWMTLR